MTSVVVIGEALATRSLDSDFGHRHMDHHLAGGKRLIECRRWSGTRISSTLEFSSVRRYKLVSACI